MMGQIFRGQIFTALFVSKEKKENSVEGWCKLGIRIGLNVNWTRDGRRSGYELAVVFVVIMVGKRSSMTSANFHF